MSSSNYGYELDPYRKLRDPHGAKGVRQFEVVVQDKASISQNQQLLIRFPNLGSDDVIVPGTARLAFTISLTSATDKNRTLVQNIGRAIVKKIVIKISGHEVATIDDSDIYHCYTDLWKTSQERDNAQYQGIDTSDDRNIIALRVGAEDAVATVVEDKAVADTFGNRFYIPLDFELLDSHMPFYQSALRDRLEYYLTFNDYSRVIMSTDVTAKYQIDDISLEFEKVTQKDLARSIKTQYDSKLVFYYDRIYSHGPLIKDKSDTKWNINLDQPASSLKGILMLFEDPAADFARDTEAFYNPKITNVAVAIEGVSNQLYAQGMPPYRQWDEASKFFAASPGSKRDPEVVKAIKGAALADVTLRDFLSTKYALWLDLRLSHDDKLHGSGRRIGKVSEGMTIRITKEAETAGKLNVYIYSIMDAQVNIENGRFLNAIF